MSQEKTLRNLQDLGFSKIEAQIYLLLGKRGPQKAKDMIATLKINRQHLYELLKDLENKGLITSTLEHPTKFSAEPFEKILDLFIKSKNLEAKNLEDNRFQFLADWQSIAIQEIDNKIPEKFSIIEGRKNLYSKLFQMTEETQNQLMVNLCFEDLVRADQNNFLNLVFECASKSDQHFRFLIESSSQNINSLQMLFNRKPITSKGFECRVIDSGLGLSKPMIIKDGHEALFLINHNASKNEQTNTCLWTNCKTLIQSFNSVFENSWNNAIDIEKKITEIATGKPITKTGVSAGGEYNIFTEHKKALKKIAGFDYVEAKQGTLTEKILKEKIVNADKFPAKDPKKDILRLYGTQANAVIYPPKNLNLPGFLIIVSQNNKKSSFGAENLIQIYLQMKVGEDESFFPAVFVTDNLRGYRFHEAMVKIRRSNEFALLLSKDELSVQVNDNKLIAGWTVPITVLPPKYILPPACIIFEGYGETRTYSSEMIGPINPTRGYRLTNEFNLKDAFVTFINSSSDFNQHVSDGILLKERILTYHPPKGIRSNS